MEEIAEKKVAEEVQNHPENGQEEYSGIITTLANLPARAILEEGALARIFGVCRKTIQRRVTRFELPPPIRNGGKSSWFAGDILEHFAERAQNAKNEAQRVASRIKASSPRSAEAR